MVNRLELHEQLLKCLGKPNVYFQPPESFKLVYPAIVYKLDTIRNRNANNRVYKQNYFYQITVIDKDPDSEIVDRVSSIPTIKFNTHFKSDNLNHYIFTIY